MELSLHAQISKRPYAFPIHSFLNSCSSLMPACRNCHLLAFVQPLSFPSSLQTLSIRLSQGSGCSSANTLIMRKSLIHNLLHDKGPSVQAVDIECLILNQNISG